jgi:hypothetical protein
MKKIALASAVMIALGTGIGFAAPINNLGNGQTAIGVQDHSAYIEHKFDTVTLGLQEHDIYGQYDINKNLRLIAGSKDYNNENSKLYGGVGLTAPLANNVNGYTSLVAGSGFKELQLGANVNVAPNVDVNVNYRSLMPDQGSNSNRTSVGASLKF